MLAVELIILPFCTHEGSGLGGSERDIWKRCPNAKVLPVLAIRGGSVKSAGDAVQSRITKNGSINLIIKMETKSVKAYGTEASNAPLIQMNIDRREPTAKDIEI